MAVTCARCGTQNPDGNRFCMSCGTPLVPAASVAAAAPPPPAAAPMPPGPGYAPPPGYQSPYYAAPPGTGAPVVHRTPWVLIISIVVGVVLILGAIGTIVALAGGHKNTQSAGLQSISSPSPISSPSAGQTPEASPSPTSQPSQPSGGGQPVSNDSETINVPADWQVANKDANSITLQSPDGDGALTIASGPESPPQSAQQLKDQIDKQLAAKYPDAAACQGSGSANGPIAGENGIFWTECFTVTSGGQSLAVAEPLWVGANANGSVAYVVVLQTTQDNLDTFVKECLPILQNGITWKLK